MGEVLVRCPRFEARIARTRRMILGKEKAPDRSDTRVAGEVGAGSTEIEPAELHRSGYVMKPASDHGLCPVGILLLGELGSAADHVGPSGRAVTRTPAGLRRSDTVL